MKIGIAQKIALLLLLPALMALGSLGLFYAFLAQTAAHGHFIDVAGRQRLLAEQLGRYAHMVHIGQQEDREALWAQLDLFEQSLAALEQGGPAMGEFLPPPPAELAAAIAAERRQWEETKPALMQVGSALAGDPKEKAAYVRAMQQIPLLVEQADRVVKAAESRNRRLRQRLGAAMALIAGLDLVLLLAGVWVVKGYLAERRQSEEKLRRLFRREEAMGRIRDRIIGLRSLGEVAEELERFWVEELRGLGIPIHSTSLQLPAEQEGHFTTFNFSSVARPRLVEVPLADYPWVREAWESGRPVIVDRGRLDLAGFEVPVRVLVEVPLSGGGSVGMNSLAEDAFGAEAIRILEQFAGLLALEMQRLRDFETLRRAEERLKVDVALQWVRNEILSMQGEEDWKQVLGAFHRELRGLVAFKDCGINLLDRQRGLYLAYELGPAGVFQEKVYGTLPRSLAQALDTGQPVYRRNRAEMDRFGDPLGPETNCVLDVPFSGGTVAINSAEEEAFGEREIAVLERFALVMGEAHRRLEDLRALERHRRALESEVAMRKEAGKALQRAFRREEAMGRFRDRIIAMRDMAEMGGEIEKVWIEELRGLGIPVNRVSLQLPAPEEGCFLCQQTAFLSTQEVSTGRLADAPWVEEAWKSRRPVVVDRERLAEAGFRAEVQSLLEVPLPGIGSLGLNSLAERAFGEEEVRTVQTFTRVLVEGIQRLRDFEALRRAEESLRVDVALQRVRNEILSMQGEEDWKGVVRVFKEELRGLVKYARCGINLLELRTGSRITHTEEGEAISYPVGTPLPLALRQALETGQPVYRRNRAELAQFGDLLGPETNCVLDVPFSGGTVAINSAEEDAFSDQDIAVLERFALVMGEAHRRLEDLKILAQRESQLRQAQHLEGLGQLAKGVAHEINNPLTSVLGYSELLLRRELDPGVRQHLETIHQEGERARQVAERLLRFSQRQKAGLERASLNEMAREALGLVRRQCELQNIRLVAELAEDLPPVRVQPGQVQQLVLNLIQNSQEAILKSGKGALIRVRTSAPGAWVRLEVEDDGPGIPEQLRARIFEPFFTTKEVGEGRGSGLGLSLCHGIARAHGGRLWAEPRAEGALLVLELPASPE
jgi:signal transduction histidine kinase